MTASVWLRVVARRGGTCRLDECRRVWVRPKTALTPALRAAFPELKAALVAVLVGCGSVSASPAPTPTFPCPRCRRPLPAARRQDRDFTVCVCCKLDVIERGGARPPYLTVVRQAREREQR
jgi:hypothetical protein